MSIDRDLGSLEANVQRDLGELFAIAESTERRLTSMETKIDRLLEFEAQAKGGYKLLLGVGSIAGVIASLATAAFLKIKGPG